jgi:predicted Zn-dependent protease
MRGFRGSLWALLLLLCATSKLDAEQNCPLPPSVQSIAAGKNVFSDQQEADLGDVMAESLASEISLVEDEALESALAGHRRSAYPLSPNKFRFRFALIELHQAHAFSLVGGRIYVSRKMVVLTQNDDELAVLAHETGHIVTHQKAIRTTRLFRDVLGVTQVGDRADMSRTRFRSLPWRVPDSLLTPMWICGTGFSKRTEDRELVL